MSLFTISMKRLPSIKKGFVKIGLISVAFVSVTLFGLSIIGIKMFWKVILRNCFTLELVLQSRKLRFKFPTT